MAAVLVAAGWIAVPVHADECVAACKLIGKAGLTRTRAATGAVTLIQRFGSALNLNIHFHMLFLDGVYLVKGARPPVFRPVAGPAR